MRKSIIPLIFFIITAVFVVGCSSSNNVQNNNLEDVALKEAKKYQLNKGIL